MLHNTLFCYITYKSKRNVKMKNKLNEDDELENKIHIAESRFEFYEKPRKSTIVNLTEIELRTLLILIKKEKPKKVLVQHWDLSSDGDYDEYFCPVCELDLGYDSDYECNARPDYCCICGQKLDWGGRK